MWKPRSKLAFVWTIVAVSTFSAQGKSNSSISETPRSYSFQGFRRLIMSTVCASQLNDYVNPAYVFASVDAAESAAARQAIVDAADRLARDGPWSARSGDVLAASGDPADYLSWAPEYWPECDWCPSSASSADTATTPGPASTTTMPVAAERRREWDKKTGWLNRFDMEAATGPTSTDATATEEMFSDETAPPDSPTSTPTDATMSTAVTMSTSTSTSVSGIVMDDNDDDGHDDSSPVYFQPWGVPYNAAMKTTTVQDAATPTATRDPAALTSCIPSATNPITPEATWTICTYVVRPGTINPDSLSLPGYAALSTSAEAALFNALASAFTNTESYATNAVLYIRAMFVDPKTAINPSAAYAQVVRGPGSGTGTSTGLVEFRSLVKVVNAIQILKAANTSNGVEEEMRLWAREYRDWLEGSAQQQNVSVSLGDNVASVYSQRAALYMLEGEDAAAISVLQQHFAGPFQAQITETGEQPHEASQLLPFHARCANLEAMILNAKLGAALGIDLWSGRTSQGATIRDAVNFAMAVDPGTEDATALLPHVAAAAAAYGDPEGKYSAFLEKSGVDYQSQIWWFFDQPEAVMPVKESTRSADVATSTTLISASSDSEHAPTTAPVSSSSTLVGAEISSLEIGTDQQPEPLTVENLALALGLGPAPFR